MITRYPAPRHLMTVKYLDLDMSRDTAYYVYPDAISVRSQWGATYWLGRLQEIGIAPLIDPDLVMDEGL